MVLDFRNLFRRSGEKRGRDAVGVLKPFDREKIAADWQRLKELADTGRPSAYKEAVITADKLLDYALTQIASGETLGERLKNADAAFPRDVYQGLWDAHKMRNALVHEASFDLPILVAKEILDKFARGFQALGANL